jgi:type VI secretion system FHA domain protein
MSGLTLTIVSYRGEACPPVTRAVNADRYTIGRGASFDWDLPDRTVSRPHCVIERLAVGYTITDVSSHGVFLNGAAVRLGHGNTTPLADGDVIAIGVYDIKIGLHPGMAEAIAAPSARDGRHLAVPVPARHVPAPAAAARSAASPRSPVARSRKASAPSQADAGGGNPAPSLGGPARVNGSQAAPPAPARPAGDAALQHDPAGALRAFLEGAGVGDAGLPPGDDLERLHDYGVLFRELVSGLRDLLATRSQIKTALHLPQTRIGAYNNNPFKFSVNVSQVVKALLAPETSGYSAPLAAIREGVEDLKAHEAAFTVATNEALAALMTMLSPQESQKQAEAAGLLSTILPNARKAAWWDAYQSAFQRATEGVEADLAGGFRRTFTHAYTEQVKKLRKA